MLQLNETESELIITSTPRFIWFVNVMFVGIFLMGLIREGTPWWVHLFMGGICSLLLFNHHTFRVRSVVDGINREVRVVRWTLFGRRDDVVPESELVDLNVEVMVWGDNNSRQPRYTLRLLARNIVVEVIHQSSNKAEVDRYERKIRAHLGLQERLSADSTPALPAIPAATYPEIRARCEGFASEDNFSLWAEVPADAQARLSERMGLDDGAEPWLYVDTALLRSGRIGLVVGRDGLYWFNEPLMDAHTRRTRLGWREFARLQWTPDPNDDDILLDGVLQIGLTGMTNAEKVIDLLKALQNEVTKPSADVATHDQSEATMGTELT